MAGLDWNLAMVESSRRHLSERVDFILDLMEKEHHEASTHSERNAFQAVIRIELQLMRQELLYADVRVQAIPREAALDDDIPI